MFLAVVLGSSNGMPKIHIASKTWQRSCSLGDSVGQCRKQLERDLPSNTLFTVRTFAFCQGDGLEMGDADLLAQSEYHPQHIQIIDHAFREPESYSVTMCTQTTYQQLLERLNKAFKSPYRLLENVNPDGLIARTQVRVGPGGWIILRHGNLMRLVPAGIKIPAERIRQYFEDCHLAFCSQGGLEADEGAVVFDRDMVLDGPDKDRKVLLMVNGLELQKTVQVCSRTTAKQLKYRLTRHYGPVSSLQIDGKEAHDADQVRSGSLVATLKSTDQMLLSQNEILHGRRFCRWCTLNASIAGIMAVNAVVAIAAALIIRHRLPTTATSEK